MSKNEENKSELCLNMKINTSTKKGIFNYSSDNYVNYNEKIANEKYFIMNENNIIKSINSQIDKKDGEFVLFKSEKKGNIFRLNIIHLSKQDFIENIDNYFLNIINSDSNKIGNTNDDYYLSKNDIIKIANVKLIVREIKINNNIQKNILNK